MITKPNHVKDLAGKTSGRLSVLSYFGLVKGRSVWRCRCSCGEIALVKGHYITTQRTKSCGCLAKEVCVRNLLSWRG